MTDAELIAWMRDLAAVLGKEVFKRAADRIEDLVERNKELALQLLATQGHAADRIDALIAERDRWKYAYRSASRDLNIAVSGSDRLKTERDEAESKLAENEVRLRKAVDALEFYAAWDNWMQDERGVSLVDQDEGKIARATLAELKGESHE